jgi:predicted MFS family arabinose efflux permease
MLIGNIILGRLVRPAMRERLVAPVLLLLGAPMVAVAFPLPFWVTVSMLFVVGMAMDYSLGLQRAFLAAVDPEVRGQAFALNFTGLMTMQGIGPLVSGAIADTSSVWVSMAIMGAGTVVTGLVWLRFGQSQVTAG